MRIFNVYKSSNEIVNDKFACWVQDEIKWKINDQNVLKINGGIRLHHSGLNQEFLMNPRLKMEWIPIDNKRNIHVWISTGLYHQAPFYREMRAIDGSLNTKLKAQKSVHYVLECNRNSGCEN
ncbi:MAG: hypothetical protein IPM92_09040 [Saprospiraceae bacterium]|nr:hypothetical protein [Saprospiraceae bacterium]